ncbi:UDP-glucosyltransferase 2-like [Anthonomus grandis grandis]|uniref:UDP-glucosyltransferase 2-like n=1 Tax=Anthonomus grandis grandis TaxID=2921223 RepID=UPI0021664A0D|nr:UDP-glucosyltransferase 2-like [Anthonomus grandis grandis]
MLSGHAFSSLLFISSLSYVCQSARILGIFPTPGRSHYILESTLMTALVEAGHDVTIVTPFYEDYQTNGTGTYRQIVLTGVAEQQKERRKAINLFQHSKVNPFLAIYIMNRVGLSQTESTLKHANFQRLIHSGEKFDAVIVGQFMNDALKAMAHHFGAHLILFSSVGTSTWVNHLVGNPSIPSYTPEMILSYPAKMTYFQRMKNTLVNFVYNINQHFIFYPKQSALLKKYLPNPIGLNEALFNVSLVLMNTHESIAFPTSTVPCMRQIGGFHVKEPKELPLDLRNFLDEAEEGVVYFSLGSNVNSNHLPLEKKLAIAEAFSDIKERVLWKFEDTSFAKNLPKNVKVSQWFPQQDILAHKNMKLFITHAGYASTIETVHRGVPIIAVPIFGDQSMNAVYAETKGFGKVLPWQDITKDTLVGMIREVIDNPKYKEAAKRKSALLRDREVHPLKSAVYWIEYVLKHNGAHHLRVASLDLTWYQYYLLDVYLPLFLGLYILWCLCKRVKSLIRRSEKVKVS